MAARQATTAFLIVTADDLGLCPEVDAGILEAVRAGVVTAAAVLVNPPHVPDLAPFLAAATSLGLHLNLSLGKPVCPAAEVFSLVGPDGTFAGGEPGLAHEWKPEDLRRELAAQVEAFRRLAGRDPAHLTSHKHVAERDSRLFELFLDQAVVLGCPVRTRREEARRRCGERGIATPDRFVGDVCAGGYWTDDRLRQFLARPEPGVTELMCHPGRPMAARPGVWYAPERDVERRALVAAAVAERRTGWTLTGFEGLRTPAGGL